MADALLDTELASSPQFNENARLLSGVMGGGLTRARELPAQAKTLRAIGRREAAAQRARLVEPIERQFDVAEPIECIRPIEGGLDARLVLCLTRDAPVPLLRLR